MLVLALSLLQIHKSVFATMCSQSLSVCLRKSEKVVCVHKCVRVCVWEEVYKLRQLFTKVVGYLTTVTSSLSLSRSLFPPCHTLPVKKCPVNKTMSIARTFAATASFTGSQKLKHSSFSITIKFNFCFAKTNFKILE